MPTLSPELDALVMQWNNHAPAYDSWPNTIPLVTVEEVTNLNAIWQWGYQAGAISIGRNIRTKNITQSSDELVHALPGIDRFIRIHVTRPLPVGSALIQASPNIVVLVPPDTTSSTLWVIEMGCSHMRTEHTTIGSLVERFRCEDCHYEYEVDHGD